MCPCDGPANCPRPNPLTDTEKVQVVVEEEMSPNLCPASGL